MANSKEADIELNKNGKPKFRFYYDACTLESTTKAYGEILNGSSTTLTIISHLSIGEAYGNAIDKSDEAAETCVELIEKLRKLKGKSVKIVGNDVGSDVFCDIQETFPTLDHADALHLATAIKNKCDVLRTIDQDLYGLNRKKVHELGARYDIKNLSISKKDLLS